MSSENAIGVFDSGLGGLSAVKEFLRVLPQEKIIYFGDTGRVPYGTRSRDTIKKYAVQDTNFLLKNNVKMIVAACGTVSSVAGDLLRETLPVPYTGVVNPTAYTAVRVTRNGKIGVIGTAATVNSHSYKLRLQKLEPKLSVYEQACPLFVPLVENGVIDRCDIITMAVVARYLSPLKEKGIDTLILGCTHFPLGARSGKSALHAVRPAAAPILCQRHSRRLHLRGGAVPRQGHGARRDTDRHRSILRCL